MCTVCQATGTFDPARHTSDWTYAALSEGADAAAGVSTTYTMAPGDTFFGTLGITGDRDWVAVTLQAGQSYEIDLTGAGGGGGTLSDPYLRLYDSTGTLVAQDDDSGVGLDSALIYTASTTGVYYVAAGSYGDAYTGTYTVSVSEDSGGGGGTPEVGTLDEMAAFLTDGFWEGNPRAFDTSSSTVITVNITKLTAEGQQLARWALDAWEMVADLQFVEVTGAADIDFDDNQSGAFAGSTYDANGVIISSYVNVSASWIAAYGAGIDSYAFSTYVHEIGHALGLGHQGPYDGSAAYPRDAEFANDSYQLSVMSYFSQTDNPTVNASYAEPITPMMADIIAIQNLYGAPGASSVTAGDTVWGANSTLGIYLESLYNGSPDYGGGPVAYTIYDRDGNDTLDLAFSTTNDRIDLMPESFSDILGLIGNVGIARGTIIENVVAGSGNDTILGNQADNSLNTGGGANLVYAGAGNDTVTGGAGADELWAGRDDDTVLGGAGNDTMGGADGNDSLDGGVGNDQVWGGPGNDTALGGAGNDTLGGAAGNDRLEGGGGNDELWGSTGNDTLLGGGGDDLMGGFTGADSLLGGAGRDEMWGAGGNDTLRGGDGDDEIGGGTENDLIEGNSGNDSLYGGLGNDTVLGGSGDDLIFGAAGDDSLDGGLGNDTIYAGPGNDTVVYNDGADELQFFSGSQDRLELDDALWGGGLTAAQVVSTFGATVGGDFVLDFGGGNTVTLVGLGGVTGLESQIDIF